MHSSSERRVAFSHELLKTFAAVPVASALLVREDQPAGHAEALVRLGFAVEVRVPVAEKALVERELIAHHPGPLSWSVHAIGEPLAEAAFDWVVWALPADPSPGAIAAELARIRTALRPGGWCYLFSPEGSVASEDQAASTARPYAPRHLTAWADTAQLVEAATPWYVAEEEALHAIYRRVESDTPV